MAVQQQVMKGILAGVVALTLSGCVTVPDAIKVPVPRRSRIWCGL
ncbi:lipoprotein [Citrobacter koseri]|nr:lipoprotein [Citrobacter koseri]